MRTDCITSGKKIARQGKGLRTGICTLNMGAFFLSEDGQKKPGFPLQVLGSANALPVGFPLQSLARAPAAAREIASQFRGTHYSTRNSKRSCGSGHAVPATGRQSPSFLHRSYSETNGYNQLY
ncbi:MAG: hypothetical protein LBK13_13075 [Spirochaetales bacterium]|nr:hypothetical protein [Spirochaetales bacterium]